MFPFLWDSKNILHVKSLSCKYFNMTDYNNNNKYMQLIFQDNTNEKESMAGLN